MHVGKPRKDLGQGSEIDYLCTVHAAFRYQGPVHRPTPPGDHLAMTRC